MVAHAFNPGTHSGSRDRKISVSLRPAWSTEWVPGQSLELHRKTLSPHTKYKQRYMYMNALPTCMYIHHTYDWCLQSPEDIRSPGTGVTHSCELPCGYWELNQGPLQEQLECSLLLSPAPNHKFFFILILFYFYSNLFFFSLDFFSLRMLWGCHQRELLGPGFKPIESLY